MPKIINKVRKKIKRKEKESLFFFLFFENEERKPFRR